MVEREPSAWVRTPEKALRKHEPQVTFQDVEAQAAMHDDIADVREIKLSLKDVNPVRPLVAVVRRLNNLVILFASGTRN